MDKRAGLRKHFQQEESQAQELEQYKQRTAQLTAIEDTVVKAFSVLIQFMDGKTTKTEVVNQLKSISTPDFDKIVKAIIEADKDKLTKKDLVTIENHLAKSARELSLIPKSHAKFEQRESVKVTNLSEIKHDNSDIIKALEKLDIKPVVEVKAPIVNVEKTNTKPLEDLTRDVLKATIANKPVKIPDFPEIPKTDLSKVEKKLDESNKHLKVIAEKPVGGRGGGGGNGTPYVDSTGKASYVELEADGSMPVSVQSDTYSAVAVDATASGDNTIVSITNTARLYYVSLSANGANAADVTAIVKIGASEKFKVSLKAGSIFARNIGAGRRYLTGSAGDDIIVNLSAAQTVHVSVEYEDI